MIIGDRLRTLREDQKLSQGDIENRTGPLPSYIPPVKTAHTAPPIEPLENLAPAPKAPLNHPSSDGKEPPQPPTSPSGRRRTISPGAARGKTPAFSTGFAA